MPSTFKWNDKENFVEVASRQLRERNSFDDEDDLTEFVRLVADNLAERIQVGFEFGLRYAWTEDGKRF